MPAGTTFNPNAPDANCAESTGTVTCTLGTLLPGAVSTLTVVLFANGAGTITNTASVAGAELDSNTNSDSEATTVNPPATTIPPGIIAAYGLDEGTNTLVGDSPGNENHGTLIGLSWTPNG